MIGQNDETFRPFINPVILLNRSFFKTNTRFPLIQTSLGECCERWNKITPYPRANA